MSEKRDYQSIPGTIIFDADMARKGYHLNQFAMSLMKSANRERFKKDELVYLQEWSMTQDQRQAVINRDYNEMIALGGNIYFLAKIFSTDGLSFQVAAASMTGVSAKEYANMMLAGGRSPEGNMYIEEKE